MKLKTSIFIFLSILYRVTNNCLRKVSPKKNTLKTAMLTGARLKEIVSPLHAKVERLSGLISSKQLKNGSTNSGDQVTSKFFTRLYM